MIRARVHLARQRRPGLALLGKRLARLLTARVGRRRGGASRAGLGGARRGGRGKAQHGAAKHGAAGSVILIQR
jgi:hypothetical protein